MSDEFICNVGEIAMGFAWLEDSVAELVLALCGTRRAAVFLTGHVSFEVKLQKIEALLHVEPVPPEAREITEFVRHCRNAAKGRNDALHSPHFFDSGKWQRVRNDKTTDVTVAELQRLTKLISDLHARCNRFTDVLMDREIARLRELMAMRKRAAAMHDDVPRVLDDHPLLRLPASPPT